jgi:hypothetical protein
MWRHWSRMYPKWPKIYLKHNKTRWNDCFDLKIGSYWYVFWDEKADGDVRISKFNFEILTHFVTSLIPDCTQKGTKFT